MLSEQTIIESSRQWVVDVIVGLNFCPFAKAVVELDTARYSVVGEQMLEPCLQAVFDELSRLDNDDSIETSLLIYPVGFESFDDYLELAGIAEDLLIDEGYEGVFQLATFHPDYCFEDAQYDDAANYTNRSPYPMLHILREASVEKALTHVTHPEKIPTKNIEVAREKGVATLRALLEACKTSH